MSKAYEQLYREIWDEHIARDHEIDLDAVDEDFRTRVVIDFDAARDAVCRAARTAVNRARTKFQSGQLAIPAFADPDEHLVTGPSLRVRKAEALDADMLVALEISDNNLAIQFSANQTRHAQYRALAPYLHQGMTFNMAVSAWWDDHPQAQAAD